MNPRKIVHWIFFAFVIVYLITGFGITEYRMVEPLTLGILNKNLSFQIHNVLWIPFLILLALHIFLTLKKS